MSGHANQLSPGRTCRTSNPAVVIFCQSFFTACFMVFMVKDRKLPISPGSPRKESVGCASVLGPSSADSLGAIVAANERGSGGRGVVLYRKWGVADEKSALRDPSLIPIPSLVRLPLLDARPLLLLSSHCHPSPPVVLCFTVLCPPKPPHHAIIPALCMRLSLPGAHPKIPRAPGLEDTSSRPSQCIPVPFSMPYHRGLHARCNGYHEMTHRSEAGRV